MAQKLSTEKDSAYADPNECVFFWKELQENGYLSNWHQDHPFVLDGVSFDCAERAMMWGKAVLFKDSSIAAQILGLPKNSQRELKKLGQKVKNFDQVVWDAHKYAIVKRAVLQKFAQNAVLAQNLLSTGDKMLVEASSYDKIWGIGYTAKQALKVPINQWAENLLGKILMEVRTELRVALENNNTH